MDAKTTSLLLQNAIKHCAQIPDDLKPYISEKDNTPWTLAETMVTSLVADKKKEEQVTTLLKKIKIGIDSGNFVEHVLDIGDDALILLQDILTNPKINKLFDKNTALPTIYFFVVFLMSCANVDVDAIRAQEGSIVRIAVFANRLLLNTQVFENVSGALKRLCSKCKC